MKTVKNNPKRYKRREIFAAKQQVKSVQSKAEATKRFIEAPVSADMYIDLGQLAPRKA